jgi:hypothetical protein
MRKRFVSLLAVFAAMLGSLVVASPAQAAISDCNNAYMCIWSNSGFSGNLYQWSGGYIYQRPNHCLTLTGSQSDTTSSFDANFSNPDQTSNGGIGVIFWKDANCTGASQAYYTPSSNSNLAGSGFNDTFSAISVP